MHEIARMRAHLNGLEIGTRAGRRGGKLPPALLRQARRFLAAQKAYHVGAFAIGCRWQRAEVES